MPPIRLRPSNPRSPQPPFSSCRLHLFSPNLAELVVSWVGGWRETLWLAPRTPPPLTVAGFLSWHGPGVQPFLMRNEAIAEPIAYGELNTLSEVERRYWLGHLIVNPALRGRGYGTELTRLLIRRAFEVHAAREVSLVVFPENRHAIRCYRAAGMVEDGFERHDFPCYGVRVDLVRMVIRPQNQF